MDRTTTWAAPILTMAMLAMFAYDRMSDGQWRDDLPWVTLTCVVLFVAVGWLYARALVRRESYEAASVLIWWTLTAVVLFQIVAV